MFDIHQKAIGNFARENPENMAQVYRFVILTIQTSLSNVEKDLQAYNAIGTAASMVWGFKVEALEYLEENKQTIFDNLVNIHSAHASPETQANELLLYAAGLPGLGIVKGGFLIQCIFGLSGCIDSHNLERFDINPNTFKASRFKNGSDNLKRKIVNQYHATVADLGGSSGLWNSWCNYVADKQPGNYENGFHVSAVHCDAIGI